MEDEKLKVELEKKVSEATLKNWSAIERRLEQPRGHRESLKSDSELRRKS